MRNIVISLSLAAAVSPAACTAQSWSQQSIADARGNTRLLMVFSPDSRNLAFRKQYALLEHHGLELTERDTVVVPFLSAHRREDSVFVGENLPADSAREQTFARTRYHVKPSDFTIILIDKDGQEQLRWQNPISIREFTARVDPAASPSEHREKAELFEPR